MIFTEAVRPPFLLAEDPDHWGPSMRAMESIPVTSPVWLHKMHERSGLGWSGTVDISEGPARHVFARCAEGSGLGV